MKVFIGYDSREDVAYQVCKYSLIKHQSKVEVIPLIQSDLRSSGCYYRPFDEPSSTEFSYTRFLTPYLSNYSGWSVFCDCDFLWLSDIEELFKFRDDKYAVLVVKHEYNPINKIKMDGQLQVNYPRKNWSSLILWNCNHPSNKNLNVETVNKLSPQELHRFTWLKDDEIGELPLEWNWLVGWYKEGNPKALHYTEGGPWFENYRDCEYSEIWKKYFGEMSNV